MTPVLVDSNVILDIATKDTSWSDWSSKTLTRLAESTILVINPLIFAEVSVGFKQIELVENVLPRSIYRRDALPYEAAFLAGKCFVEYRRRGGARSSPLPDFYIGAHAAVAGFQLLTRDANRFGSFFPTIGIIAPDS